jgi:hypothetical protein
VLKLFVDLSYLPGILSISMLRKDFTFRCFEALEKSTVPRFESKMEVDSITTWQDISAGVGADLDCDIVV